MNLHRFFSFSLLALLLLSLSHGQALAGSPFYLTVERSFTTTESPQLRLDYTVKDTPMLVRVLRPQNLERFLDGQLQISRSYEQPRSALNPGHYFINGLNDLASPLRTSRKLLASDFRKQFKDTAASGAIRETSPGPALSPPEEIITAPPAGFTVVRDYYLDLQFLGTSVADPGWWFGDQSWAESAYTIRRVRLEPLPDGVYLIQAVQGTTEAQCLLQVSSLSVQVKQSTGQLVVRVIDRQLSPVAGARISYRDSRGTWIGLEQPTDQGGELRFDSPDGRLDSRLVIRAETADGRQALTDTDFLPTVAGDDSVFILTDRPIFKPGETFFFKGTVRKNENGALTQPQPKIPKASLSLVPLNGPATDLTATVPLSPFATFSGKFTLDPEQTPGPYRLVAEIDNKPYAGEMRVRDYVKPTFFLEVIDRSPAVVPGNPFFVKFRAQRYSGGVPARVRYEVFLYRKKFEAPQWVEEAGGGLSTGTDYHGEIRSASALTQPRRIFSSVEQRMAEEKIIPTNTWDSAPQIAADGTADFRFDIPRMTESGDEEWIYTLMIRAVDAAGSQALVTDTLYATRSEAQATVRFSRPVMETSESGVALFIRTTYPGGRAAPRGSGSVDLVLEQAGAPAGAAIRLPFATDDQGLCRIPLPQAIQQGRLKAVAVLETLDGRAMRHPDHSEPALLVVGGDQGKAILDNRQLELYTADTVLSPGDKARVLALLPAGWGKGEQGTLWETIAGSRIHTTRTSEKTGRSCWLEVEARPEYGTGFYHTVSVPIGAGKFAEQTLGFRIIPRDKRLNVTIVPEKEETEPLKSFAIELTVTGADGVPAADSELAVMVVDRAVYAVQPEFRPGIFDFFYPLPRLNLATFLSDDLQGYGYADLLKKPNFSLSALKSQSRIAKKSIRDTAGWFPHVVTDHQGRATIRFDLPGNVTEWRVTAVAVDKNGRVGEASAPFRTRTDLSVDVVAPQFLRQGEEAAVIVRAINHLDRPVAATSAVEFGKRGRMVSGKSRDGFTVAARGEHQQLLLLAAADDKGAATLKVGLEAPPEVRVGGTEEFDIPLSPAALPTVLAAGSEGDRLHTLIPESATVRILKVQVQSGLLGASLNAANNLVSYPYGCTEQLVHSTIPNLVLMDLIRRAGISRQQLGLLAEPLLKAEEHAALGIKKISANQRQDGGFALWPGGGESTPAVTLTALSALGYARDLEIDGAAAALNRGMEYLFAHNDQAGEQTEFTGFDGFKLALMAQVNRHLALNRQIAFVRDLALRQEHELFELINALRIFAAHQTQSWDRFNEELKNPGLKTELAARLARDLERLLIGIDPPPEADRAFVGEMGFGYGQAALISSAMGVLDQVGALPPELAERGTRVLLRQMRKGFWISTYDSGQVILNLRTLIGKEAAALASDQARGARKVLVRLANAGLLGELVPHPGGFSGYFVDPGPAALLRDLRLEGLKGTETATAALHVRLPFTDLAAQASGISVIRRLLRVTARGHEELEPGTSLAKGETVISETLIHREPADSRRMIQSRYLVIEDGIPSLARGVDEDRTLLADAGIQPDSDDYWAQVKQTIRHPDRTVRIAEVRPGGSLRLYQVWQTAFSGRATIPPAQAFDMYDDSIRGNTAALPLRVEERRP